MEKVKKILYDNSLLAWMENSEFIQAMRKGLLFCIPFLIMGAFSIVLTSFPLAEYQEFIRTVYNGRIFAAIMWIYNATMGSLTLYVILAVSYNYGRQMDGDEFGFYMLTSIVSYIVYAQESITEVFYGVFSTDWLFTGIIVTLFSCLLFRKFCAWSKVMIRNKYHTGVDMDFRNTVLVIIPAICVVLVFVAVKLVLVQVVGVNIQNIGSFLMMQLFEALGTGLLGSILFLFLIHILWFFGIHGSNMLATVSVKLFEDGMLQNMEAVTNGGEAVNIFTKTYFDVFILMGGSGATLCLLTAILLQTKRNNRTLCKISFIPAIFNINEIVLFGLPVIFNPIMLIPFITVPLVLMGVSASVFALGIVPIPTVQVTWTTPIFFSGYLSTGSITGAILQFFLLILGTLIYMPFIKVSERYYRRMLQRNIEGLKLEMQECEENNEYIDLKSGVRGKRDIVKLLINDLKVAIEDDEIMLYYQPQVTSDESIYGVEALLRWKHPVVGFLYPPLVIELAREEGLLDELGIILIEKAAKDLQYLSERLNKPIHMAVNISPIQFESDSFCEKVGEILRKYDFNGSILCFEVTEHTKFSPTGIIAERIEQLRKAGIPFHMDDFGMGHSSMKYLQSNEFEAVKLDGSLVRQMLDNDRSQNIISGIKQMALPLNYELIAEYVETEEQKKMLGKLGCNIYQGTLYSWPIPMKELETFLKDYNVLK